ncbi:MAG: hypothetical protein SWK76_12065 [Actinomycetota bacterium]|nr:hypothetical protein [Actinomycetota bacterium]
MAFELIVKGGEVVDGSGRKPLRADVGVEGDRITAVGDLGEVERRERCCGPLGRRCARAS